MAPDPLAAEPDLFRRATHWYRDAADLMARVGTPELPQALDDALRRLIQVDLTVCFAYPERIASHLPARWAARAGAGTGAAELS